MIPDTHPFIKVLDDWQLRCLKTPGNILVRSGRQVGKSHLIALKCALWALKYPDKFILIISKTEKQAYWIFAKTLYFIHQLSQKSIMTGPNRPTKHIVKLTNKTSINCYAAGETGFGLMGPTANLMIADEAAYINAMVYRMLNPTMAVAKAEQWLLSTPYLDEGYFYECEMNDPSFTLFYASAEDCPRRDDAFLAREKAKLTEAEYAQIYLGQYRSEFRHLFPQVLIDKVCTAKRRPVIRSEGRHYLGCDVARMDRDEFTYEIFDKLDSDKIVHVENIVTRNIPLTESARRIVYLNDKYDFMVLAVDSGGMGIAICDILRENNDCRRKVLEINNASRPYDPDDKQIKILKDDLYMNLRRLMEKGQLQLLDDDNVRSSLWGIQVEQNKETGRMSISGEADHVVEGITRGVWAAAKDKTLKFWCR